MKSKLEFIEGKNNILLIVPHGHPKNDMNTGKLTRKMAELLNCYAVINEYYRRPYTDKDTKEIYGTNKEAGIVDLNNIAGIRAAGMEEEFLQPIFDISKKIVGEDGMDGVIILHIHGIGDDKFKNSKEAKPPVLVGIGRGVQEDRLSTTVEAAEQLIKKLGEDEDHPLLARIENGGQYSGWAKHNLNQLFTGVVDPGYKDENVQSIQLEIKYTGFRDKENLDKTANTISSALRDIAGLNVLVAAELAEDRTEGRGV